MYDLNFPWPPSSGTDDLERVLSFAQDLGYHTLALSHTIPTPLPAEISNPLPTVSTTPHPQPPTASTTTDTTDRSLPVVLHRATLLLSGDLPPNYRLGSLTNHYHIIALRPQTERSFTSACLTSSDAPLISLDLAQRLPFQLRSKTINAAVARGVRFEINYGQLIGRRDPPARISFMSNLRNLVRVTRGRGLVVSSEAPRAVDLRRPIDIVNMLAYCAELKIDRGWESISVAPRGVVANEGLQRRGFRGVVEVVQVAEAGPSRQEEKGDGEADGKQQQQQHQQRQGNGKKKNKKRKGGMEQSGQPPDKKPRNDQPGKS